MLLLVPIGQYELNLFFPALTILLGAHYLPFATSYGMRMFLFLAGILMAEGVLVAYFVPRSFSFDAWVAGVTLFVFAWIGRSIAMAEAKTRVTPSVERAL